MPCTTAQPPSAAVLTPTPCLPASRGSHRPQVGAVVEYPLRDMDCTPSRTLGVGLLVGRNMDRGDARKLPPDQLDLCEIEPLQQQEPDSVRCAYAGVTHGLQCASGVAGCPIDEVVVEANRGGGSRCCAL